MTYAVGPSYPAYAYMLRKAKKRYRLAQERRKAALFSHETTKEAMEAWRELQRIKEAMYG